MTEVVTSSAAISQLSLLAQRQQVFGVERPELESAAVEALASQAEQASRPAPINEGATAGRHDESGDRDTRRNNPGPSRARVEIHRLDLGLTPSEVVGTLDVLQRFDENGDGRVDLLESDAAALARQKVFTFAGLAAAPVRASSLEQQDAAPPTIAVADAATAAEPRKIYTDVAIAATGAPAAKVDVPKKFYGQGAEVVVSPAAVQADTSAKLSDRVVAREQAIVTEDGTGEARLYDKVAQTDTGNAGEQSAGGEGGQLYDRAQLIAAAIQASKKTVVAEAYAGATPAAAAATTVVTA